MSLTDREHVSTVINFFWGKGTTTASSVNKKAALVAYKALADAKVCSRNMDLVPRPEYGRIGVGYALTELAKIGKRIAAGDVGIYESCKGVVGLKYKSDINAALLGI